MAFEPVQSTEQGKLGRRCTNCGEIFLIKSAGQRISHMCVPVIIEEDIDIDLDMGTAYDEDLSDL